MKRLGLLASAALSLMGCAEPLRLMNRAASASTSPYSFWPPPPGSALWVPPASPPASAELGDVASHLEAALVEAGYAEARWYPIGSDHEHGFALTTRLERRDSASGSSERWSTFYPEPASLRWLTLAQAPALPHPAAYRAFLIAFTDLPMPGGAAAPVWNERTLMDGPGAPERRSLPLAAKQAPITPAFRFGVYEYRYDWDEAQQRGRLEMASSADPVATWPPALDSLAELVTPPGFR